MVDRREVIETAEKLCEHSPRMWENESEAAAVIRKRLQSEGLEFREQQYDVVYPEFPVYELRVDGEEVECLPSGLESGKIDEKNVIDNVSIGGSDFDQQNINFNPHCPALSKQTFYEAPSVTISRQDVQKVLEADEVEGRLEVKWGEYQSTNFLVGNTEDPEMVVFTHYDSWWGGFLDNAFSVSLLLHLAPELDLGDVLIVFAGSEEVSHEDTYWCYGYRQFEKSYHDVLQDCSRISVVDTIGRGETHVTQDDFILGQALVLHNRDYIEKTDLVIGEFDRIMEIYHSPIDTRDKLTHPDQAIERVKEYFADYLS
ncbi:MAG: hypothetical protein ABEJ07_05480 [Candidatus Nanohaloarchaea archaeon]